MQIYTDCPLPVASVLWRPEPDAFALMVVCKATFTLEPTRSPLAAAQEKPIQVDIPWRDGVHGSIRAASDLVPFKRYVDVLVVGHAHAPPGQSVTSLVMRVRAGKVDKRIAAHGNRWWAPDGRLTPAEPFTQLPLRWERAAGGPDTGNPAGVPANAPPDATGLQPAPNLLPIGLAPHSPAEVIPPVGLGPIAPAWPERAAKLRRHLPSWHQESWADLPLPQDLDAAYFNVAPADQQTNPILLEEPILLEHLHPEHAQLVTVLEKVTPHATLKRAGAEPEEIRLRCDTLCIDADRGICTLTWRGVVRMRHRTEEGVVIVTADLPRTAKHAEGLPRALDTYSGGAPLANPTSTAAPGLQASVPDAALPFSRAPVRPSAPWMADAFGPARATPVSRAPAVQLASRAASAPAAPGADDHPTTTPTHDLDPEDGTGTLVARPDHGEVYPLPFRKMAAEPEARTLGAPSPAPTASHGPLEPAAEAPRQPPSPGDRWPAPPPHLWPIATPEVAPTARRGPQPVPGDTEAKAPSIEATTTPGPGNEELPLDDYPIERCAAIAARIESKPRDATTVLEAQRTSSQMWQAIHAHWLAEIHAETARSRRKLLLAYDAAYVAALEEVRGPVTTAEYARLVVAAERGHSDAALGELALPRAALLRIRRVWLVRMVKDPRLGAEVSAAVQAERES